MVICIAQAGILLKYYEQRFYVPFDRYPAFRSATIDQIYDVVEIGAGQLRWPSLDIDIEVESLLWPEKFPLQFHGDGD